MKVPAFLCGLALLFAACGPDADGDKTEATDQQKVATAAGGKNYVVDTTQSLVTWTGYKATGQHTGTFRISEGSITTDSTSITAGNFTINVASITDQDLEGAEKSKLETHLKSADFFEVSKFPTAKFEITKVAPYSDTGSNKTKLAGATHFISGNLTLRNQAKNVTFPAKVNITSDGLTANADFDIDRTDWGMNYKGPNNPLDWAIRKEVNIKLNIVAKTQ
jgi:polyisoprenoid-binding protein YceI